MILVIIIIIIIICVMYVYTFIHKVMYIQRRPRSGNEN